MARLLKRENLGDAERLCLSRVRAIITYGANRHNQVGKQLLEESLKACLRLKDQHLLAVRALRGSKMPAATTDPREAFKGILRDYPNMQKGRLQEVQLLVQDGEWLCT